jgi:hypothetical protein
MCNGCHITKRAIEFCRPRRDNPLYEHATCNHCSERLKSKRKAKETEITGTTVIDNDQYRNATLSRSSSSSSTSHINRNLSDLQLFPESDSFTLESAVDSSSSEIADASNIQVENNRALLYELNEVYNVVLRQFEHATAFNEPVDHTFEIELDAELMDIASIIPQLADDRKTIREKYRELSKFLIWPIESASGYYWEIRNIYLCTRHKQLTHSANIHLGCTMRDDRAWQRPEDQPVKRRSETRAPINRYNCAGNITLTVDIKAKRATVDIHHQVQHEHPTYRQASFPNEAKEWIKANVGLNLRNTEVYRRLWTGNFINPELHTKEQVYYWTSVYKKETYIMNQENQLLSAKVYLEQQEFSEKGFKVLYYIENDFVRALGFITPLFEIIGAENVTEVNIDSTFKTNQERFELFAVNANCGGYGMPIAYLYLCTYDGTEEARHNPENETQTRVEVLRRFFSSLRREGLKPVFVLSDKDSGEISAVSEAWLWITNIQLCYWHLEHAIDRKIKDKKSKANTYTAAKASEANRIFNFIDPSWIPRDDNSPLCPDEFVKEILSTVKKHANMHPLIPQSKDTFLSSRDIRRHCVEEMYRFCHSRSLVKMWGYLWTCWYNEKDWKLFARSSCPAAMPLARTTMISESHWRVLKYNYKYNYNRPRLDQLTQILAKHLIPDFEFKLAQYNRNRGFPAWWQNFKDDWNSIATADIEPGMEDRHHVDVNNWVCSCRAYLNSRYLLCKHLVAKKNGRQFIPTYAETIRRHDYPFLIFRKDNLPIISPMNNPWVTYGTNEEIDTNEEEGSRSNIIQQETLEHTRLAERRRQLAAYKSKFESALMLYEREIDNDNFVRNYEALMRPIVKAVKECEEALQAYRQQGTWGPRNGMLAFWLR